MGMFDEVACRYPLELPAAHTGVWQTKSLDNALFRFEIDAEGLLWFVRVDRRPDPGWRPAMDLARTGAILPLMRPDYYHDVARPPVRVHYTGPLEIHAISDDGSYYLSFSFDFVGGRAAGQPADFSYPRPHNTTHWGRKS